MPLPNDDRDGLRRCRDCGEWKPLEQFHTSSRRPSGRGSYCQLCYNVRSKASYAKRVKEQHGREVRQPRALPAGQRYCPDCERVKPEADFVRTTAKASGFHPYCKQCHSVRTAETAQRLYGGMREYHLRRRYGIGQKQFDELLAEQGGVCAICGAADPAHVDHDHFTGYIRGILCFTCNVGLGNFADDIARLTKASTYLRTAASWAPEAPGVYRVLSPQRGMYPVRSRAGERRQRARANLTIDQASE